MTATTTGRPTQTVETTAAAAVARAASDTQTDANRLTFAVVMIAVMVAVMVIAVVGAIADVPTLVLASPVLATITIGVGIYVDISLLQAR